jgi:hypothetical protein
MGTVAYQTSFLFLNRLVTHPFLPVFRNLRVTGKTQKLKVFS